MASRLSASQPTASSATATRTTTTRRASTLNAAAGLAKHTNMLTFETGGGYLKDGRLKADDGTVLEPNDHVYLVCEPPGEPYYLARIMEFLYPDNDHSRPVDALRVNWYYRPRDINRGVTDTRLVFASMHSDTCPLTSLRGKCHILHRSEIQDLDEYRKTRDCFWYEKMFDRYNRRYYDVIPTSQVINVPVKVKKVLDEHWRFILVEMGRGKELTSAVKACKRCNGYCASNDSVECAVCHMTYHMNCVRPPLLKKPSRGFAWACGPCNRMQERKLEARNTPLVGDAMDTQEDEVFEEEDEEVLCGGDGTGADPSSNGTPNHDDEPHPATEEQSAHAKMWPFRYLGQHCRVEDALDYDDRIYPRVSSRLGGRHQVPVPEWQGRPVEYVKKVGIKKKYLKGGGGSHKKDAKLTKETIALLEADKREREARPKWVVDEPPGYIRRGEDHDPSDPNCTAQLAFKIPEVSESIDLSRAEGDHTEEIEEKESEARRKEESVDRFLQEAQDVAEKIGVKPYYTNFIDRATTILCRHDFDLEQTREELESINSKRKDLGEPDLNREEQKRFEEGVSKYGSELHSVAKHVRTQREADIVRYYYMWKKSERGQQVWGNYAGRKGKKEAKRVDAGSEKLVDDVADDIDDSAFDSLKAIDRKRGFACKFCSSRASRRWRRAPAVTAGATVAADGNGRGTGKDKGARLLVALCSRCAELWRRYGIQWEDINEVAKKVAQGGGRAWKRRIDEELLKELVSANELAQLGPGSIIDDSAIPAPVISLSGQEPPRKKQKQTIEKDTPPRASAAAKDPATSAPKRKVVVEKQVEAPPAPPEMPKPKTLPCAVCDRVEPLQDQHLSCKECRMSVHRHCYGVVGEVRSPNKWTCDMCANDKTPQVSMSYECVLCPVRQTEHDFIEPPKISHKKKTDRERERERLEREMAVAAAEHYRKKQAEMGRPMDPREPLKRTAGNNWIHVTCAVWTPEIKFGLAKGLEPSEGVGTIPPARYEQTCKVCKTQDGACVGCHQCHASVHVACAQSAGYTIGFDVNPKKGSRRDLVNIVTLGSESGLMTAAVWCKEHAVKTIVHPIYEAVDETGMNALQLYVQNYKQADLTLTGTVRKANLVNQSTKAITQGPTANAGGSLRRTSTANGTMHAAATQSARRGSVTMEDYDATDDTRSVRSAAKDPTRQDSAKRHCITCGIDVSPKWWGFEAPERAEPNAVPLTNGDGPHHGSVYGNGANGNHRAGSEPEFQCHKCHWRRLREPSPVREVEMRRQSPQPVQASRSVQPPPPPHPSNAVAAPAATPVSQSSPSTHPPQQTESRGHAQASRPPPPVSTQAATPAVIGDIFIGWTPQGQTQAPAPLRAQPPMTHHAPPPPHQSPPRAQPPLHHFSPPSRSPQMHSRNSSGGGSSSRQQAGSHIGGPAPPAPQQHHPAPASRQPAPSSRQPYHHHHRHHSLTGSPSPHMRNGVPPMTQAHHQQSPTSSQMINGTHPSLPPQSSHQPPAHHPHNQPYHTQQMRQHQSSRPIEHGRWSHNPTDTHRSIYDERDQDYRAAHHMNASRDDRPVSHAPPPAAVQPMGSFAVPASPSSRMYHPGQDQPHASHHQTAMAMSDRDRAVTSRDGIPGPPRSNNASGPPRPGSNHRPTGGGASASPSLKNLLD